MVLEVHKSWDGQIEREYQEGMALHENYNKMFNFDIISRIQSWYISARFFRISLLHPVGMDSEHKTRYASFTSKCPLAVPAK